MDKWIKFLFGTPRRTLGTIIVILVLVAMVSPNTIEQALNNLLTAVQPLVSLAISILILIALLKWAFKKLK
jgi:hypothetical protein